MSTVEPDRSPDFLSQGDLADLLQRLSSVFVAAPSGNTRAAKSLRRLAEVIRKAPPQSLEVIFSRPTSRRSRVPRATAYGAAFQDRALDQLDLSDVDEILALPDVPKVDLVRVAAERFGMSPSSLLRLNRDAVLASLRSAMANERALHLIADAARYEGQRRVN